MERRIGLIYDAIDEHNYKLAVQHCNKLLKKYPAALQVMALKALALCRAGKTNESLEQCTLVRAEMPTDPAIMQPVSMVYRALGLHDDNATFYEAAFKAQPHSEEMANYYFMALARGDSFKAQHQLAIRMHKTFKSNKYLFWAVNCMLLQSKNASDTEKKLLLTLAERMMVKAAEDNKIVQFEELLLYASVLMAQNKHEVALGVLSGDLAGKFNDPLQLNSLRIPLMTTLEQWEDLNKFCVKQLQEGSSDWSIYSTYVDTLRRIKKDEAKAEAELFINEQIKLAKTPERSSYLVLVELQNNNGNNIDYSALKAAIVTYFKIFGSKPSCYADLSKYIGSWPEAMVKSLSGELQSVVDTFEGDSRAIAQSNAFSLIYRATSVTALTSPTELATAAMEKLKQHFNNGTPSSNGLVYLASAKLVEAFRQSNNTAYLAALAVVLEAAREKDNLNFQYSLILCRVYSLLGCGARAVELYETLNIKHVQHDTLSYLMTDTLFDLGLWEEAEQLLESSASIYNSNIFETPEMIAQAYKHATFSQIENFIEFRDRLSNSLQREVIRQEQYRIELLKAAKSLPTLITFLSSLNLEHIDYTDNRLSQLSDNRDYEPFPPLSHWDGLSLAKQLLPRDLSTSSLVDNKAWRLRIIAVLFNSNDVNANDLLTQFEQFNNAELPDKTLLYFVQVLKLLQRRITGDIEDAIMKEQLEQLTTKLFEQMNGDFINIHTYILNYN
ncbi:N-acetyltransferase B complex non catalytic subunit-domain-containing protein [Syncephalis fuscata]|nr:N-acetyltransferase B complex non catalytic subunit-domain-containing protein [Syncephalis fuscata]